MFFEHGFQTIQFSKEKRFVPVFVKELVECFKILRLKLWNAIEFIWNDRFGVSRFRPNSIRWDWGGDGECGISAPGDKVKLGVAGVLIDKKIILIAAIAVPESNETFHGPESHKGVKVN